MRLIAMQGEMMARTPVRSVIREDMFDAQIALGELHLQMRNAPGAEASLNNALETARILMEKNPKSLYSERCLQASVDVLALDEALTELAQFDERKARAVEMKFQ